MNNLLNRNVDISFAIVSWNTCDITIECLDSIFSNLDGLNVEVVVVDNASTDNSVQKISMKYPQVMLIDSKSNLGFSKATNIGINNSTGSYVFILNPDTVIQEGALRKLFDFAESHKEYGLIGPKLISPDSSVQNACARPFPRPIDWFFFYSFLGKVFNTLPFFNKMMYSCWDHCDSREVEAICGAAMFVSRKTIDEVGLLDESHPMYLEDIDYCYRVWQKDFKTFYWADVSVLHYGGKSSVQVSRSTKLLGLQAHHLFFKRYNNIFDVYLFKLLVVIACSIRLITFSAIYIYKSIFSSAGLIKNINTVANEFFSILWALGLSKKVIIEKVKK